MANISDLEKVILQLKSKDADGFAKLDYIFEEIVNNNARELVQSMDLLENFLVEELNSQKNMDKAA